jgi:hypothetical protein
MTVSARDTSAALVAIRSIARLSLDHPADDAHSEDHQQRGDHEEVGLARETGQGEQQQGDKDRADGRRPDRPRR